MSDFDELADRLSQIASELDEHSSTLLREAARSRSGRPAADKTLTQARRAVEKAVHLLRHISSDPSPDDADVD